MICLFSSIKEIFTGQLSNSFQGGACKAIKSVFIDPYTRLPDSNSIFITKGWYFYYQGWKKNWYGYAFAKVYSTCCDRLKFNAESSPALTS